MEEVIIYFKNKFAKNTNTSDDQMKKTTVKNTISDLCEANLKNVGDIFTFEVVPKYLPYVVTVIDEEPLNTKYVISQVSKTLFEVVLKEIEI